MIFDDPLLPYVDTEATEIVSANREAAYRLRELEGLDAEAVADLLDIPVDLSEALAGGL